MNRILTHSLDRFHALSVWKLLLLLGFVLIILLVALYFVTFYRTAQKRDLDYAVTQINLAISSGDLEHLAPYVDFLELGKTFAADLRATQGLPLDKKTTRAIRDQLQLLVLESLRSNREDIEGEIRAGKKGTETPPLLPADARWQLQSHPFRVQGGDDKLAILTAPIKHAVLDYATDLKLVARNEAAGWKVVEIANAKELITGSLAARKKLYERRKQDFLVDNVQRSQVMNLHCYITDSRAFLARRGNKNDTSLIVTIEGFNLGLNTLLSCGIRCYLKNAKGQILAVLPLNSVRHVEPTGFFQQRWQVELSEAFPETPALLREEDLHCSVEVSAASLSSGQILFLRPKSELDKLQQTFDPDFIPPVDNKP